MTIYAGRRLNKLTAILILFAAVSITQACDPGRELAKNTARAAGAISSGLALVDQQTTSGQMSRETGLRILAALEASNKINGQLTDEAKKYVSADGKRLELTGDGKLKLLQIGASGQGVITALLNDPAFTSLPSERRAAYVAFAQTINNSFSAIVQLVAAIKPQGVK